MTRVGTILLVILVSVPRTTYGKETSREIKALCLPLLKDQIVSTFTFAPLYGIDNVFRCLVACTWEHSCQSFFYQESAKCCILNTVVFTDYSNWEPALGMKYYRFTNDDCPGSRGYIYDSASNLCYKFHISGRLRWPDARQVCQGEGGDLISLDTMEKYNHTIGTIRASSALSTRYFYIGATDAVSEGNWLWLSGVILSATSDIWAQGEPNNGGANVAIHSQNYAVMPMWSGHKLDDATLDDVHDFVCEIKIK